MYGEIEKIKWGHYELIDEFYCDIYKRREYSEDEEEFMSAMTTLLLGREFYEECGLTDEDYEESLRNSNNKYIKEVMDK